MSFTSHGHALLATMRHLTRHRLAGVLTVLAIALALALPLTLQVLVDNVAGIGGTLSDSVGLSVYLKPQASEATARQLAATLRKRRDVSRVTLISAAAGLALLRQQAGLAAALDALPGNPLPNVLEIHPAATATGASQLEALRAALAANPNVDAVQLDRDWAQRFDAIVALMRELLQLAAALLAVGVIAIIGNTVRLEVQGRSAEIEITQLVGGSNAYVRRPFLYAGILYGALGALLACGIVLGLRLALAPRIAQLAAAYGSHFMLHGPSLREVGMLVGLGVVLGWLGARLTAGRHIARLAPQAG